MQGYAGLCRVDRVVQVCAELCRVVQGCAGCAGLCRVVQVVQGCAGLSFWVKCQDFFPEETSS